MRILLIEDEREIAGFVANGLREQPIPDRLRVLDREPDAVQLRGAFRDQALRQVIPHQTVHHPYPDRRDRQNTAGRDPAEIRQVTVARSPRTFTWSVSFSWQFVDLPALFPGCVGGGRHEL